MVSFKLKLGCEVKGLSLRRKYKLKFKGLLMSIFGSALGGALGVGGAIFGGISASRAMKRAKANVEGELKRNQAWYDRRYNEDATQRADAQRVLTAANESIRERNRQAGATRAVTGGTVEGVAAAKGANNAALAEAASQIAVNGERRKDGIESEYLRRRGELNERLNGFEYGRANGVTQAIGGVAQAAGSLGSGVDDYLDGRDLRKNG